MTFKNYFSLLFQLHLFSNHFFPVFNYRSRFTFHPCQDRTQNLFVVLSLLFCQWVTWDFTPFSIKNVESDIFCLMYFPSYQYFFSPSCSDKFSLTGSQYYLRRGCSSEWIGRLLSAMQRHDLALAISTVQFLQPSAELLISFQARKCLLCACSRTVLSHIRSKVFNFAEIAAE